MTWRCPKKGCKKKISVRVGSYFEGHRLSIGGAWPTIVCLLKFPKMLGTYLAEILEISQQTLVDWGNYVRETISHYSLINPLILRGEL